MLVDPQFETTDAFIARNGPDVGGKERSEVREEWEALYRPMHSQGLPTQQTTGVYSGYDLRIYLGLGSESSHEILSEFPLSDEVHRLGTAEERLRSFAEKIRSGTLQSDYGSADDIEQILAYYRVQVDDPDRTYIIVVHEASGGYRFRKNGPYIGKLREVDGDGDEWLPEYVKDCTRIKVLIHFNLIELRVRAEASES